MNKLTEYEMPFKASNSLVTSGSNAIKRVERRRKRKSSPKVIVIALAAALCIAGGIFGVPKVMALTGNACYIVADGEQLVALASQDEAYEAIDQYLTQKGQPLGVQVTTAENLDLEAVDKANCQPVAVAEAVQILEQELTPLVHGAVIKVNGDTKMFVASEEKAEQLIESAKAHYVADPAKVLDVKIRQDIAVETADLPADRLTNEKMALNMLIYGSQQQLTHNVESSDETLWTIAKQYNLDIHDLKAANPGLTSNDLQLGTEVRLADSSPLLTVVVVRKSIRNSVLPYNVETRNDSSLARGTTKTISEGQAGQEQVTWQVVEENGIQVSEQRVSSMTMVEPVDAVVARGTKITVASRSDGSTGVLGWPLSGKINSDFGSRRLGYHTGIDIDGNTGDTYVASDAGTVTFAGWNGSYGYMVKVDHGDGLETWYAHSSSLSVSAGQQVGKGQKLGEVGSTGRSTGPHLHFEVRINGEAYNPLNYLP